MLQTFVLKCPECGREFERSIDSVGLEEFVTECPDCRDDVTDRDIIGETGGPKPIKLMTNY